jgi:integrase
MYIHLVSSNLIFLDMLDDMPKIAKELSALEVKRLSDHGWHAVGGVSGLLLQIKPPATYGSPLPRSWILRIRVAGQRQLLGLGAYPEVSVADAREKARNLKEDARNGVDLIARKRAHRSAILASSTKQKTFKECAIAYMEAHASDYSNEKHKKQWASTLQTYAYPKVGNILAADITMRHILDVLLQTSTHRDGRSGKLWHIKPETAKRLLDRMRTILDFATVNEYRSGTNPAVWKGYLDTQLPSPRGLKKVKHHPAIPYARASEFMVNLRKNESVSARALEFLILTAVRSGSVRLAEWSEIDFENKLWIIPSAHTKAKREHRVPLQIQAIQLLKGLPRFANTNIIFSGPRGNALSDMAISQLMRRMRTSKELLDDAVPHGFRSTFRDWAAEQTSYPDEIRKAASGHAIGDTVQAAYQRTDLLEKRRKLMNEWADYLGAPFGERSASVIPIRKNK